ncbi:MAG: T9SS type A sorting domain-containing protein [Ignavibacteria bacterium]|nr:T9SS type A sorting domain-containing protein [Ignavibacteria bacterium]
MNSTVRALIVYNNELYAAGSFTNAGGVTANRIAKWNGSSWSSLGLGLNGSAYALEIYNNSLIVGGYFSTAGGLTVNNIAKWNGSWSALGSGTNSTVFALSVYSNKLVAGGAFLTVGGVPVNKIATWDGNNWFSLGNGLDNGTVYSLSVYSNDLIVGGSFTYASGVSANRIAKWNGSSWSPLGSGTNSSVYAFSQYLGNLYVGGSFSTAGGLFVNRIARWNGSAWSGIGGVNSTVQTLGVYDANLILGGYFTVSGGSVSTSRIAKWGAVPIAPTLISPPNGAIGISLTPTLNWNDIPNAFDYGVQLTNDPNFQSLIINVNGLTSSEYTVPTGILDLNTVYFWRANARNGLGTGPFSAIWFFTSVVTNISTNGEIPNEFRLYNNYPNPFNPTTNIKFSIPTQGFVTLKVFNSLGKEVATLVNENTSVGTYEVNFDAGSLTSGVYFYRLQSDNFTETKRMMLIK